MPKLSLIIPTYNEGAQIEAALDLIVLQAEQCLMGIELIIVDDQSSDDTHLILQKYGEIIKVLQTDVNSGGAGTPRNLGVDAAIGDYIAFYDIGDTIDLSVAEQAIALMEARNVSLAVCKHVDISSNDEVFQPLQPLFALGDIQTTFRDCPLLIHNPFSWSKIYKTSWIREKGIRFGDQYCGEDKIFTWSAYLNADNILLQSKVMYGHKFFGPDVNRMLQRNLRLVESVISIDRQMRANFKQKGLIALYNNRLFNRDLCGIILETSSVEILKRKGEFSDAISLLRAWLADLIDTHDIDIARMLTPEHMVVFAQTFPDLITKSHLGVREVATVPLVSRDTRSHKDFWYGKKVAIIDPGLANVGGHHQDFDKKIGCELLERGAIVTIYANRSYPPECIGVSRPEFVVAPWFKSYPYLDYWLGSKESKEISYLDAMSHECAAELAPVAAIHDVFLFPTLFPYQLCSLAQLDLNVDTFGIVHLSPTNKRFDGFASWTIAMNGIKGMRKPPQIGVVEQMLHHEFDGLFMHDDPLHILPYPVLDHACAHQSTSLKKVGLFGAHRWEQGGQQLGQLLEQILGQGLEALVHDISGSMNLSGHPRISTIGHVDDLALAINMCDALVLNYDTDYYRHMGSGLAWDALSVGVPVLCSRGIAPSRLLHQYSSCIPFQSGNMASFAAALRHAQYNYQDILTAATAGRERMLRENGRGMLIDYIGEALSSSRTLGL